jgi:hypothetical protein
MVTLMREQLQDDCPTQRYSDDFLLRRINMAMMSLYAIRPDAFPPEIIYVDLVAGVDQMLPENATFFGMLGTGYRDTAGNPIDCTEAAKPTESNDEFLSIYSTRCKKEGISSSVSSTVASTSELCNGYAIKSFSYELKNGRHFTVDPALPVGTKAKAKVLASKCPLCTPEDMDAEVPCKYFPMIFDKAMALVYGAESEDASNVAKVAKHEQIFSAFINAIYQSDSRQNSGYYLGRTPSGDPDPRIRRG